jgi:hypothetical protein
MNVSVSHFAKLLKEIHTCNQKYCDFVIFFNAITNYRIPNIEQ